MDSPPLVKEIVQGPPFAWSLAVSRPTAASDGRRQTRGRQAAMAGSCTKDGLERRRREEAVAAFSREEEIARLADAVRGEAGDALSPTGISRTFAGRRARHVAARVQNSQIWSSPAPSRPSVRRSRSAVAGRPATTMLSGTSWVTRAPAATMACLPTVTPGSSTAPE